MKTPSTRFIHQRYQSTAAAGDSVAGSTPWATHSTRNSAKLVSGPTTEIMNSSRGPLGSAPRLLTPPRRKRVMPSAGKPRALATREWASSWMRTETKRSRAATIPVAQYVRAAHPAYRDGRNPSARLQVKTARTTNHE